jgi:hypothetical protein
VIGPFVEPRRVAEQVAQQDLVRAELRVELPRVEMIARCGLPSSSSPRSSRSDAISAVNGFVADAM